MPANTTDAMMDHEYLEFLLSTLKARDDVSKGETATLAELDWRVRDYSAESEIIADRTRPNDSCLLLDGIAARAMSLENGERQITAMHVRGDFVDIHGLLLRVMDHSVVALTPCRVAFIEHAALRDMTEKNPHLGRLLFTMIAIDAAIQRNWILCLGRRKAEARLAHLFCELFLRLELVGGTNGESFSFPISQSTLADVLGLSIVHTNRTVQHLRSLDLVGWRGGMIEILDWKGLCALAEFDPVYLNLFQARR